MLNPHSAALPTTVFVHNPLERPLPRLPQYVRAEESRRPSMRLTTRDKRILEAIHAFDGVLSDQQIKHLFFSGTSQLRLRMRLLYQHGYVVRPDRRRRASLPTMVYWLDERGADHVAGLSGITRKEFRFRREPKWSQLEHDLAVNDLRLAFMDACGTTPGFTLEEWIPQGEFWAQPDRVTFTLPNGRRAARYVRPDGFCVIQRGSYYSRLLVELDRASEDNPRIGREKILPGIAYLRSPAYKQRFGFTSGRWLFVTTSERRLQNMKRQTEVLAGDDAKLFYFTTSAAITSAHLLTAPLWQRGGESSPTSLFPA